MTDTRGTLVHLTNRRRSLKMTDRDLKDLRDSIETAMDLIKEGDPDYAFAILRDQLADLEDYRVG